MKGRGNLGAVVMAGGFEVAGLRSDPAEMLERVLREVERET